MTQNRQTPAVSAKNAEVLLPDSVSALTDEQFAALLAGDFTAPTEATGQSETLLRLQTALRSYRSETTQWAERRSAGQASLAGAARRGERWAALPRWSLAMVALVTIAGGVAHLSQSDTTTNESALVAVSEVTESATAADIAADNRLLSSINDELSYHSASPIDSLGLRNSNQKPIPVAIAGETE